MELANKVALITGGTRGIGAATAIRLARSGADIAISGRHHDQAADEVRAAIEALGRRCVVVVGDMGRPEDATRLVNECAASLGGLDVLVHSAGGGVRGRLLDLAPEAWYQAFDVHVHAVFHLCRAAVPFMQKRKEGAIILISSAVGHRGFAGTAAYCVVKGTLPNFARTLARELADDNIRVNCVAPGIIRTRFHEQMTPEQYKNNIENRIPLHREGTAEDVADLISTLVTNDFITGETVAIDGGMTMRLV
ncbi:MAG TPA: SDR family oxidoreductase [Phycisphaerae bacterium]|nr:SDR family oxidoreductase [Phycisphaerae bacterium]HOJ73807.1 SDR family oxidoreductase [Phycisphaerae bacterium]HOM50454.1 SDR family oxidoreductase [Phycisphaerae bacterium]HON65973.1 SDR family oxidoreductase [Phycisphaerae bacterium]HOQ85690.1 SDR family oxidoreductase [Phycisphaerae bacterium]